MNALVGLWNDLAWLGDYWSDVIGFCGVALYIYPFAMVQMERMSSSSLMYIWLNIMGAVFICISLSENFNLAAFISQVFWIILGLIGLSKRVRRRMEDWKSDRKRRKAELYQTTPLWKQRLQSDD